jgi:hypothetical protein
MGEMVVGTGHVGVRGSIWMKCCQILIINVSVRAVTQANVAGGRPDVEGRAGSSRGRARWSAEVSRHVAAIDRAACALRMRLNFINGLRVQSKPINTAGTATATWKPTSHQRRCGARRVGVGKESNAHDLNTRLLGHITGLGCQCLLS